MKRLKKIVGYTAQARFVANLEQADGFVPSDPSIPSPYAFTTTRTLQRYRGKLVVMYETAQRTWEVFELPRSAAIYRTEDAAHNAWAAARKAVA